MRAAALQFAGNFEALPDLHSTAKPVTHIGFHHYGHIIPGRTHHLVHTHTHEPHPVPERTAVLIPAPVRIRREKLTDQVAMPGMHLDSIETGFARQPHRVAEGFGLFGDFIAAQSAYQRRRVNIDPRRG